MQLIPTILLVASTIYSTVLAGPHGPVDDEGSVGANAAPLPLVPAKAAVVGARPGADAFAACGASSDCVMQTVSACCGGVQTICMNKAFPSAAGNCKVGGMGICVFNPPPPTSCSCQHSRCFGVK